MRVLRVLLVDDDPGFLDFAGGALAKAKYSVTAVSDLQAAENALQGFKGKAVVLSDLNPGKQSALAFLTETLKTYPQIPFTLLAHSPKLASVIEALKQGAYDFLRKPVPKDILCHSVARSIEKLNLSLETEQQEKEIRNILDRMRGELKQSRTEGAYKGFVISTVAHDFRSILTVLDGYHQILKEKCLECTHPVSAPLLEQARRSIGRLRTMSSTLLDYDAAERGALATTPRRFELDILLRESVSFYQLYAEQKKVRMEIEETIPSLTATADPDRVMQVLDNLLYNAIQFTPARGEIRVGGSRPDGAQVVAWVRDTGPGISSAVQKKLFDEKEIASKKDGNARLGLGLNICRRLIEAQNGKIWIESTPGEGTTVFFSLPG